MATWRYYLLVADDKSVYRYGIHTGQRKQMRTQLSRPMLPSREYCQHIFTITSILWMFPLKIVLWFRNNWTPTRINTYFILQLLIDLLLLSRSYHIDFIPRHMKIFGTFYERMKKLTYASIHEFNKLSIMSGQRNRLLDLWPKCGSLLQVISSDISVRTRFIILNRPLSILLSFNCPLLFYTRAR